MTRNLKALGLALVAAFAMSAIAASAAHATFGNTQLTAEAGTTSLHAQQEGLSVLTRGNRTVQCNVATYSAPAVNGQTEFTFTPVYSGCEAPGIGPATVTTNGCTYTFTLTADAIAGGHTWTSKVDLTCPAGKQIEIHVYTSAANHASNTPVCTYDFGPTGNQELSTVELTPQAAGVGGTAKDWITADITIEKITSTSTIGSVIFCGVEHDSAGVLHGNATLEGRNAAGGQTGITPSTKIG